MAMTFTLASLARELLQNTIATRLRLEKEEDDRKTREYEEAEAKRTRGTPLTPEAYLKWRKAFLEEMKAMRAREEEERVKALPPKEREEYRRKKERLSGGSATVSSVLTCRRPPAVRAVVRAGDVRRGTVRRGRSERRHVAILPRGAGSRAPERRGGGREAAPRHPRRRQRRRVAMLRQM